MTSLVCSIPSGKEEGYTNKICLSSLKTSKRADQSLSTETPMSFPEDSISLLCEDRREIKEG